MKRLHIHVGVDNLDRSVGFYSSLFGTEPEKRETDYAKWMLEDPRINFAISTRAGSRGVDHLGLQVDDENELEQLREQFRQADMRMLDRGETQSCYAHSDKSWLLDPEGIAWEAFTTLEDVPYFSGSGPAEDKACCTPETKGKPGCCVPLQKLASCC